MKKVIIIALLAMLVASCGHHGTYGGHHADASKTSTTVIS